MKKKHVLKADLCIIGAGSAGLSVAAAASQMGARVILIEKRVMGGECLHYGCVPSKTLIAAAKASLNVDHAETFGISVSKKEINYAKINKHIRYVINKLAPNDSKERFSKLGVRVIKGSPHFVSPKKLEINNKIVKAKYFVIATGSSPFVPPIKGLDEIKYLTNETIFNLKQKPKHLIIVGGGPIGCEIACAYALLGVKVTVLQRSNILPLDDQELVGILKKELENYGINFCENVDIDKVSKTNDSIKVSYQQEKKKHQLTGSHILIATGRKPNLSNLGLDDAKIRYNKRGIIVDKRLRTNHKHIFALGDVINSYRFTHVANYQAGIVIRNALFHIPTEFNYNNLPWVTYTEPELAHIGLTEKEARKKYCKIRVLKKEFNENDRAHTERDTLGMIKVITRPNGKILGASILAHEANNLISVWGLAMQNKLKIKSIAELTVPYPTRSEINKHVAGTFYTKKLYSSRMKKLVRFLLKF